MDQPKTSEEPAMLNKRPVTFIHTVLIAALLFASPLFAEGFPPAEQAKIDAAIAKLTDWAASAEVLAAVKAGNAAGDGGMNNGKWVELGETAPEVTAITSSAMSTQLGAWREASGLNKLFLRAKDGHLVAGVAKPLVYNISSRPTYKNAMTGKPWQAGKAKPDPTTQVNSVQISVPVMDGGEAIGVLHSSVIVQ